MMGRNDKKKRPSNGSLWFSVLAVALLVAGFSATKLFWNWLHPGEPTDVSNSETLRNVGLLIGGALAFVFAAWRAWVAERQANAAQAQVEAAQVQVEAALQQVATARRGLSNERYQRGAQMLGSDVLSGRLAGIYTLQGLAEEDPSQYHIQIMKLFCSFVRNPGKTNGDYSEHNWEGDPVMREDVQAILTAVGVRGAHGIAVERETKFTLDLSGADLSHARLSGANFAGADLSRVKFHQVNFFEIPFPPPDLSKPIPSGPNQPEARTLVSEHISPDLREMEDRRTNLSLAVLIGADLSGTRLMGADLSGAQLAQANLAESEIIYANMRSAVLMNANLSGSFVHSTNLTGALLGGANLDKAHFHGTKLYGANFFGASLKEADFSGAVLSKENGRFRATGLCQNQLNEVIVSLNDLPDLTGVVDYDTKKQLVWNV